MTDETLALLTQILLVTGALLVAACGAIIFMSLGVSLHYNPGSSASFAVAAVAFLIVVALPARALFEIWRALGTMTPLPGLLPFYLGPALAMLGAYAILTDDGDWFIYFPLLMLGIIVWLCGRLAWTVKQRSGDVLREKG